MMVDWNGYRQQLVETIGQIARLSPETVKGHRSLRAAGSKTKGLDAKTRELIALAVAVSLGCDRCITVHTDAAIEHGASQEELAETLTVALLVNAGAALATYHVAGTGTWKSDPQSPPSGCYFEINEGVAWGADAPCFGIRVGLLFSSEREADETRRYGSDSRFLQ